MDFDGGVCNHHVEETLGGGDASAELDFRAGVAMLPSLDQAAPHTVSLGIGWTAFPCAADATLFPSVDKAVGVHLFWFEQTSSAICSPINTNCLDGVGCSRGQRQAAGELAGEVHASLECRRGIYISIRHRLLPYPNLQLRDWAYFSFISTEETSPSSSNQSSSAQRHDPREHGRSHRLACTTCPALSFRTATVWGRVVLRPLGLLQRSRSHKSLRR
jgi:hypothetical protein